MQGPSLKGHSLKRTPSINDPNSWQQVSFGLSTSCEQHGFAQFAVENHGTANFPWYISEHRISIFPRFLSTKFPFPERGIFFFFFFWGGGGWGGVGVRVGSD